MAKCSPARKARLKARHAAERAIEQQLCDNLRRTGASCATCSHLRKLGKNTYCLLDSDWEGHAVVKPDFLCSRFGAKLIPAHPPKVKEG